jgi:hypothetical protein
LIALSAGILTEEVNGNSRYNFVQSIAIRRKGVNLKGSGYDVLVRVSERVHLYGNLTRISSLKSDSFSNSNSLCLGVDFTDNLVSIVYTFDTNTSKVISSERNFSRQRDYNVHVLLVVLRLDFNSVISGSSLLEITGDHSRSDPVEITWK